MKSSKNIKADLKLLVILFMCIISLSSAFFIARYSLNNNKAYNDNNIEIHDYYTNRSEDSLYLSDINYVSNQSYVGWDRIRYDQIENNGKISLKIENSAFVFKKGIWAHATSQITYDISNYNYKYFTAFVGINTSSSSGNGVIFSVYTSETGTDWVRQKPLFQETKLPGQNATKVKVSIEGAKYLRLIANSNGSNANDHSVYADAKLVNSLEETYDFKSVDDYNTIIKEQYTGQEEITGDLEFNLLRREFVKRIGQFTLSSYKNASEGNKETVDWLFNNIDVLRYFILGGVPERSYYNSLTELTKIYTAHKEDFSNAEVTKYGTKLSDLYTRMAIAMALTHDFKFGLWIDQSPENLSIAETRYRIYKDLHKNGNFIVLRNADGTPKLKADGTPELDITEWFENYSVEEMRYIFNNQSDDEEVLWLNEYTQSFIDASGNYWTYLSPHPYMDYRPENLGQAAFYDPAKKDDWDKTFKGVFSKYNVTYRNGLRKIWMFLRNDQGVLTGAVCGGISKIGTMTRTSHGIPAVVVGQPGHAAIVYYWQDAKGNGYWTLDNDVFGWQQSERGERLPLGWGNANSNYARGSHQVVYLALSQEALNDYDNLVKAEELVMLSDVYTTDEKDKKEETYRKAIEKQSFNLDAWLGLINLYLSDNTKTEEQLYNLSEEVAEALKYYPLPMYQLTNLIKPRLTSVEFNYKFTLLQTRILTEASLTPNNTADRYTVYQPSLTRLEANYLLGSLDRSIATFSFDGADAGKIVLSNRFNGTGIRWDYAINGKGENGTWDVSDFKEVSFSAEEEHKLQLTPEEIASITSENDIYIHIVGVGYEETNLYKIDITESAGLPSTLFANDLENRIIGAVDTIEWKYNESDEWKRYGVEQPDLTGDKKIILRMGAIGTKLAQKTNVTYTFTQDSDNNRRKYIPVEHISLVDASSQATNQQGSAAFALDANYNTRWHSAWDGSDTRRFITVKLDSPRNISAVEFVPAGGGNGKIYDGTIWGSMDGVNWSVLTRKTGLTYTNQADTVAQAMGNIKSFDIEDVQRVQYIRIVADRTNGNWITARAFNFYEDTTLRIVASFSFDGNEAGKINLIDPEYNNNWRYSLDGGNSWTSTSGSSRQLTDAEISQITSENGIKLMLAEDDTIYSIKIKEADELVLNPYVNDLENRLIGLTDVSNFEWKYSDTNSWTSYSSEEPIVKGTKTLQVRTKAMGITLPSNILEFDFTEDNQTKTARYIPIKHLTIHGYSTQSIDATRPFYAPNVIDGNPNTIWHTDFRYNVKNQDIKPFVTIKLDSPRNISALDFIQKKYRADNPDDIQNLRAYVSLDGKEWTLAGIIEDCERDNLEKTVKFDKPVYGQYVKLEMDTYDIFASLANVNLYEDVSMTEANISIQYSTTNKTNRNVVATLVSDKDITITNNGGLNTYTFDENGQFIFEYIDATGEAKSFIALVDWIDKKAPIGTISYSVRDVTNENVIVTLTTDEEVIITNNGGKNTYEFSENGTFTFEFEDAAGNKGTSKADVTWINKKAPVGKVSYSTTKPTNGSVVATLIVADDVIVTNNSGSKEYTFTKNGEFTFEFVDKAGNRGTYTAKVSWIDRTAPKAAVTYSTKEFTNKNVTATLIANEEVTITNNGGSDKYVFNENGEFTFEFKDKAGNISEYTAKVDWIDKVAPTADIRYSTTDLTNEDVIAYLINASEDVTIVNNDGLLTHTFSENGSFVFEIRDKAGNTNKIEAIVSNIDKEVPTAKIKYSLTKPTNKNVIATLVEESEEITVTNNSGLKTYTFTENGTFEFEIVDKAGNTNKVEAIVSNIDKKAPTAEIEYSTTDLTNEDVIAKLVNASEEITITNNNGSNTYLFTKNGEFTFEFVDKAGNTGIAKAVVNNINKDIANAKITYSKNELTNEDVTATVTFDKDGITITNNDGNNTYIFTENGKFKFEYIDKSGNAGVAIAEVTWIDKEAPSADVEYSTADLTNQDVTVRLVNASEDITIVNNNGSDTYTFTENGTFEFEIVDKAGNTSKIEATVSNIDKILPTAKVKYSTTEATNENVITTLTLSEEATIVNTNLEYTKNEDGTYNVVFSENGKYIIKLLDKAGNCGQVVIEINWIDKEAPSAEIEYSTKDLTNSDVTAKLVNASEEVTIVNNDGKDTYIFDENGEFEFEIRDAAGNTSKVKAEVSNIDKVAPTANIKYSTTRPTNKDVVVTLVDASEEITITNNGGSKSYTFTENGEFTFEFVDKAGNTGTAKAVVNNINKDIANATITYSKNELTNEDVTVTVTFDKEEITITNNEGNNTHTFTDNGIFIFEYTDKSGNNGVATAEVTWIDKVLPTAEVEYSTKELTNSDVTAKLVNASEEITIVNNEGKDAYIFTENGVFEFEIRDAAGNTSKVKAEVSNIDKVAPVGNITYSKTDLTNGDVIATLTTDEEVTITNNNGSNTYVFNENGKFTFEFVDKAGNTNTVEAEVTWINKTPPVGNITYESNMLTNQNVIANLEIGEGVIITNNEGSNTYVFTDNGLFTFEFVDAYGNTGSATAKVDWIDKVLPTAEVEYSTIEVTSDNVIVRLVNASEDIIILNNNGLDKYEFTENGEFTFEFKDRAGNTGSITAKVDWIKKESGKPEEPDKPVKPEEPVKPTNPSGNTTDNSNKNNGNTNTNKEDKPVVNNKEDNNKEDNNKEDNNKVENDNKAENSNDDNKGDYTNSKNKDSKDENKNYSFILVIISSCVFVVALFRYLYIRLVVKNS